MDLSHPVTDFLPKSSRRVGGLWHSLGLLLLALGVASAVGVGGFLLLVQAVPSLPPYSGVLIGVVALIVCLWAIAQRFGWIMPWYYLLPAILFLLTFTVFPVVLTVMLTFTDYAGVRNGELNVASRTAVVAAGGTTLELESARFLQCNALRNGCNGVRAIVYAGGTVSASGVSLEGDTLTLAEPLPEGVVVESVALVLTDIGFSAEFPVVAVAGAELTLGRTPPGEVELDSLELLLAATPTEVQISELTGDTLTLTEPLPEGLEVESVARYNDFGFVCVQNFRFVFRQATRSLLPVFTWNVTFAVLTVLINTLVGVFLAVLLNNPALRLRNLYRTLLIVPWALPSVITIQVWRGLMNTNFGLINRSLALLGMPAVDWLNNPTAARGAILLVNLWLGTPFMMTAVLGALSAIPGDLYEAAKIDGASAWQRFTGVTAPLLRTALVPITLTGFAFNFNNFNIIYLLTDGGPGVSGGTSTARATDILISWAYNEAFRSQGGYAYGLGSAISILIFFLTIAISLANFRVTGALKEESNV